MKTTAMSLTVIVCLLVAADGARILVIFPFQAKSHYNVFEPLLKRLSARGHEIVAASHYPQKVPLANFTDVDLSSIMPSLIDSVPIIKYTALQNMKYVFGDLGPKICDPVLNHPELKRIIETRERFDLFFIEMFGTDCFLGIAHILKIPKIIGAISSVTVSWSNEILKNPENPSYIPHWFSSYTGRMSFLERSINMMGLLAIKLFYRYGIYLEIAARNSGSSLRRCF